MNQDSLMLRALNEAIWLRDNSARLDKDNLFRIVEDLGEYGVFSARQISALTHKKISHQTAARLCAKTDRTGGRLNIETLEDVRECFYSRIKGKTNYDLVRKVVSSGTSQGMLAKLSGINQARISKNVRN
jgi:hypothetical protein